MASFSFYCITEGFSLNLFFIIKLNINYINIMQAPTTISLPQTKLGTRIEWLAVLQGFSMLLVVLGHVTLTNTFQDPQTPLTATIERVVYTFHMPLFIFISGWLFNLTCIKRDTPFRTVISKKVKRLGVPFLFFTIVTIGIKLILPSLMKRPVDTTEIINTFIFLSSNPLGEMWFIIVLLGLMSFYPTYRWLLNNGIIIWGLSISIVIAALFPAGIDYYQLTRIARMCPYFIAGIMCCHYNLIEKYSSKWYVCIISFLLFITLNTFEYKNGGIIGNLSALLSAFTGIILSVSICSILAGLRPNLFSSFSRYTFQIFLLGIFFQMGIRVMYAKIPFHNDVVYCILFFLSILIGIYFPVIIAKFIESKLPRVKSLFGL